MKKMAFFSLLIFILAIGFRYTFFPLISNQDTLENSTQHIFPSKKKPKKSIIKPPFTSQKLAKKKTKRSLRTPIKNQELKSLDDFQKHHQVPQDKKGNIYVTQVIVDEEHLIAHGDIIVGNVKDIQIYQNGEKPLMIFRPLLWPKREIPIVIEEALSNQESIQQAIEEVESLTSLRFPKRTNQPNYVKFKKGSRNCYSQVGMVGGEQTISLSPNCGKGEILHEILHAIGFLHEQNRPDRDEHIQILWENISEENWPQFQKIQSNLWEKFPISFSFDTIMLYPSSSFSQSLEDYSMVTREGDPFGKRPTHLTREDIRRIHLLYPSQTAN